MNITKTKFITNRGWTNELWTEGTKLTRVDDYRYLGQSTKFANNMDGIIRERISNAWKAFWANKIIWKSKMKNEQKVKILDSCVMPALTYGAQTWSLTKRQMQRLISAQNSMLRNILEIVRRDKIKTTNIQQQTGTVSIGYKIKKLKLKYAGHMARGNQEKRNLMTTLWPPREHKRQRGCPAILWIKEILDLVGPCWTSYGSK